MGDLTLGQAVADKPGIRLNPVELYAFVVYNWIKDAPAKQAGFN